MVKELPAARKIRAELEALDREYRFELPRLIKEAADQGDISDNAEYRAAKQRQEFVQARIVHLKKRMEGLSMINLSSLPKDRVGFGSVVLRPGSRGKGREQSRQGERRQPGTARSW